MILAIFGSSLLIKYQAIGPLTTIGLTLLAISLVIGVKSIIDLYAKLIGVSSLLGEKNRLLDTGEASATNENNKNISNNNRRSVGWYLGLAAICVIIFRVVTPHFTSYLLLHGGASAIFWAILSINCLTMLIFLIKFDAMAPH